MGHQALRDPEVRHRLVERLGKSILNETGEIDRNRLADQVFHDSASSLKARRDLEDIVHSWIRLRIQEEMSELQPGDLDLVVLDAALLLEAGWDRQCDMVIYVDTPRELRELRVRKNRDWSPEELQRREACQLPLNEKQQRADRTISNRGDLGSATDELESWLRPLLRLP